uniref:Uncharacterized protein n=1 Tax=Salix viminalis TaxID=40686 RepID=A0A6N2N5F1_SALVM
MPMHADSHIDMPIQAANHADSVFLSSLGLSHRPNLSSAPAADFVDTVDFVYVAELISAAKFDTVLLCLPSTISRQLSLDELNKVL